MRKDQPAFHPGQIIGVCSRNFSQPVKSQNPALSWGLRVEGKLRCFP